MKVFTSYLFIFFNLVILNGCEKNEPKPSPIANFSYTGGDCIAPCSVSFSNSSLHATSYLWDFGDGDTSTLPNPVKVYTSAGRYQLSLNAKNAVGSIYKFDNITIKSPEASIEKVTITKIPFYQQNGNRWDSQDGPDIYYNINNGSGRLLDSTSIEKVDNISQVQLPLVWSYPKPVLIKHSSFAVFYIDVFDYDFSGLDQKIGTVSFYLLRYSSRNIPYPKTVEHSENGISIKLDLSWK